MPIVEDMDNVEITPQEYERVRSLIYDRAGINLGSNRQHLVQARLAKRIRVGGFGGFREYFRYLEADTSGDEVANLIDAISTNTTFFFREADHFDFLSQSLTERIRSEQRNSKDCIIRIWSAACSSGEEPYTLAMVVHKLLQDYPMASFKLLATDISQKVLAVAREGRYDSQKIRSIPEEYRRVYVRSTDRSNSPLMEIVPELKKYITFAHFNLIDSSYPFKYGFDYVFCRNVMIYFDRTTQEAVINRIAGHLRPGGFLIVGHSESLNALKHNLQYIKPTVYRLK
jgi:chemotaxis protein methyltransferase CheR